MNLPHFSTGVVVIERDGDYLHQTVIDSEGNEIASMSELCESTDDTDTAD